LQKERRWLVYLPACFLVILFLVLYSQQLFAIHIPGLSDLDFNQKTTTLLTFALASFGAVEGYSTFMRASLEKRRHQIEDARNELEKAYGPLYALLNKAAASDDEKTAFWLEFDERKRLNEIMATYPFMFPSKINSLWQEKIRNLGTVIETSSLMPTGYKINLNVYVEFRNMINEEYTLRVKNYHKLVEA
jgi:hypothetical protein